MKASKRWSPSVGYLARREPLHRLYPLADSCSRSLADEDSDGESGDKTLDGAAEEADNDDATLRLAEPSPQSDLAHCRAQLSICYSPSYGVPVLWLEAYTENGAPLSHAEITQSTVFHRGAIDAASAQSARAQPDTSSRPPVIVSQADHPITGFASWFVHPCETESLVREVLEACPSSITQEEDKDEADFPVRWLETWLIVIGSLVDLQS